MLAPPTELPWAATHAALPAAHDPGPDGFWLYFSSRDAAGRAHIGRARIAAHDGGLRLGALDPEPVLAPGRLGAFDDSGVTVSCLVRDGSRTLLYYTGWTLGRTVPFYFYVGLAVSVDGGGTFCRVSEAPLLERTSVDPFLTASPYVLREGGRWRMWYVSCTGWEQAPQGPRHRYHVRYAEGADGVNWERAGQVALDYADGDEYAHGRPYVSGDEAGYRMWFCARGDAYRLAAAESADGIAWRRVTPPELTGQAQAWASDMQAYPWVVDVAGARYLLYNGNGYGATGIGYATLTWARL